jgi:hypothetical protein
MPFKNFSDFQELKGNFLLPTDFLVGYRELNKEFKTTIADLTIEIVKNLDLAGAPEVLYVTPAGKDTNSGRSEINALRTIKRAAAKALELSRGGANEGAETALGAWGITSRAVNIFVRTGTYIEDNPIYLPPSVTVIGDDLRAVSVIPKNKFHDIFWVNNRCYIWGITFRTHKYPSYCIAYPEFKQIAGNNRSDYPNTRVATATAKAFNFYNGPFQSTYTVTKDLNENAQNLSDDFGNPIYDPARIAFLGRYYQNLNNFFYSEEELVNNVDFSDTNYYKEKIRRPYQLTSPYPQGCSSITQSTSAGAKDAGGGVLVDGSRVDGPLRSMVLDSFTQFNEGGKGIHIINNGYAQLVSTFTICCTEGVMVESGGTCSINTSNCSFGDFGLVAFGKSPRPTLIGKLKDRVDILTNQMEIVNLGFDKTNQEFQDDFQPYPGQCFEIQFTTENPSVTATNNSFLFSVLTASKIEPMISFPGEYRSIIQLEQNYSVINDASVTDNRPAGSFYIPAGSKVLFYIRSTITTSAHTMEYIGTGTNLLSAVPQRGGQTDVAKEVVFDDVGRVYFTSTNQFGDFKIGTDLTIVQATGTIEGDTFKRSILQIVTPFVLSVTQ